MSEQIEMFHRELMTHRPRAKTWQTPPAQVKASMRKVKVWVRQHKAADFGAKVAAAIEAFKPDRRGQ